MTAKDSYTLIGLSTWVAIMIMLAILVRRFATREKRPGSFPRIAVYGAAIGIAVAIAMPILAGAQAPVDGGLRTAVRERLRQVIAAKGVEEFDSAFWRDQMDDEIESSEARFLRWRRFARSFATVDSIAIMSREPDDLRNSFRPNLEIASLRVTVRTAGGGSVHLKVAARGDGTNWALARIFDAQGRLVN